MIRKSDVETARLQNATSKNIERRQKAGLNKGARSWDGKPAPAENAQKRLERAQKRIAGQKRKPVGTKAGATSIAATGRTRKQATAAQRERARKLIETGREAPGSYGPMLKQGSLKIRYRTSQQRNLFDGVDKVRSGSKFNFSGQSRLGPSRGARKQFTRADRAATKATALGARRTEAIGNLSGKDLRRNSPAMKKVAKMEKSIRTLRKAEDFYSRNPTPRRRRR
jgi:hypothetical protein